MKYGIRSSLVMDLTGNADSVDTKIDLEPFNLTPLGDLNPFDSVFLILRRVGVGTGGCSHAASRAPSRWIQEMAEPPLRSLTGR
jgi:hypothetical protein